MQRLAARLGFSTMSLCRYVPGKDELIALMLDTAIDEPADDHRFLDNGVDAVGPPDTALNRLTSLEFETSHKPLTQHDCHPREH